jgi:predicted RNA-binding Zn-ribbon protein involved in translation (DUF1610 family)
MARCSMCGSDFSSSSANSHFELCPHCKFQGALEGVFSILPDTKAVNRGWVCPNCGAALSPDQRYCMFCVPPPKITCTGGV